MADHHNQRDGFDDLDTLFAEARATRSEVPDRLMQAILADAATEQAQWQPESVPERASRGPIALFIAALGGWPAVGGLVAASCTGLWFGINAPDLMLDAPGLQALAMTGSETSDYEVYETFDLATVLAEDLQ